MVIPNSIAEKIIAHAKHASPIEACGYLAGTGDTVSEIYPMTNLDQSTEHFSFDPKEQFKAVKDARANGLTLIACYHSHPETPARPSEEDIKLAVDPNIVYIIVSLAGASPDIKSFKIKNTVVEKEPLVIDV